MTTQAVLETPPRLTAQAFRLPGHLTLAGAPEGADAQWLAGAIADPDMPPLVAVAVDEEKALRLLHGVAFFAPDAKTLFLPAWDWPCEHSVCRQGGPSLMGCSGLAGASGATS